jgi:hypothetical protein
MKAPGGIPVSISKRADLLASEFQRFGMAKLEADHLSSELVLRHPLAHRVGVPKLACRFVGLGLAPDDATHLALSLWGLERLMLGACFQDLLDTLRCAGLEESQAFPAAVEARRLWLESSTRIDPVDQDLRLARWCVAVLALLVVAQVLDLFSS